MTLYYKRNIELKSKRKTSIRETDIISLYEDKTSKPILILTIFDYRLTIFNYDFPKLRELTLNNNGLTSFELSKYPLLTYLDLSHNKLTNFELPENSLLDFLSLTNNNLTNFILPKNSKITCLKLHNNQLENFEIPEDSTLIQLNLSYNKIKYFKPNKELIYLDIMFNELTHFTLEGNNNLEKLLISNNNLESFKLSKESNLQELYINNNKLIHFELDFECGRNLRLIEIYNNLLQTFKSPYDGNYLRTLIINHNKLTHLEPLKLYEKLKYNNNNFAKQKIVCRRRMYLLKETKGEKCYKCKKIVNKELKINTRVTFNWAQI